MRVPEISGSVHLFLLLTLTRKFPKNNHEKCVDKLCSRITFIRYLRRIFSIVLNFTVKD